MRLKKLLTMGLAAPLSVASALLMGMTTPAADIGLTAITIDCGDGAPIHSNVNLVELTKIEGVIQTMVADPSEPSTCNLKEGPQDNERETHTFIFGAGTYGSLVNCEIRFRIKASLDEDGNAHGFQYAKIVSKACVDPVSGPVSGSVKANVTCLAVLSNVGEMRGIVSESNGIYATPTFDIHPGDVMFTQAKENSPPVPDEINQYKYPPGTEHACVAQIDDIPPNGAAFPLDSGDIEVHA